MGDDDFSITMKANTLIDEKTMRLLYGSHDITPLEMDGRRKFETVEEAERRHSKPEPIYKKQKLDRDDLIDAQITMPEIHGLKGIKWGERRAAAERVLHGRKIEDDLYASLQEKLYSQLDLPKSVMVSHPRRNGMSDRVDSLLASYAAADVHLTMSAYEARKAMGFGPITPEVTQVEYDTKFHPDTGQRYKVPRLRSPARTYAEMMDHSRYNYGGIANPAMPRRNVIQNNYNPGRVKQMEIDVKKFDSKKTIKPAGELSPNDVGGLVSVITVHGVKIEDVLIRLRAENGDDNILLEFEHTNGTYGDTEIIVPKGMRSTVRRRLPAKKE